MNDKMLEILLERCRYLLPRIADGKLVYNTYSLNMMLLKSLYPQSYEAFTREKK